MMIHMNHCSHILKQGGVSRRFTVVSMTCRPTLLLRYATKGERTAVGYWVRVQHCNAFEFAELLEMFQLGAPRSTTFCRLSASCEIM